MIATLVLDLDNSTEQYNPTLAWFMRGWGMAVPDTCPDYDFVKSLWFPSRDAFMAAHTRAVKEGMFALMPALPYAPQVLHSLHDAGHVIKVATHRLMGDVSEDFIKATTLEGLRRNNIPYDEIHFVKDKYLVAGDVYIDDAPTVIDSLDERGLTRVIVDQEYNRHLPGPRLTDWRGMPHLLDTLLAKAA